MTTPRTSRGGVEFVPAPCARVTLVGGTHTPDRLVAALTRAYDDKYPGPRYQPDISPAEIDRYLGELASTKLQTPLEFVSTVWVLNDVSRAFTHQLVRYRVGTSFVQESQRFTVHDTLRVLLPERLRDPEAPGRGAYERGIEEAVWAYYDALEAGTAAEDARGLLPTNTLTSVFFGCSMRTLAHIYTQRTCCQAQSQEWVPVVTQMRDLVDGWSPALADFLKKPWETGAVSCGFGASFDRPCRFQEHFDRNLARLAALED